MIHLREKPKTKFFDILTDLDDREAQVKSVISSPFGSQNPTQMDEKMDEEGDKSNVKAEPEKLLRYNSSKAFNQINFLV